MSNYQHLEVVHDGRLTLVSINRPASMNALNAAAQMELADYFDGFQTDAAHFVTIITGVGAAAFCAGLDLKAVATGDQSERRLPKTGFGGLTYRFDLDKPVIAAVNGACLGGGLELALACDLIVASDNARFGFPEPSMGTAALSGGLQRLPRQIGLKRAMDLILTGKTVSARDGYDLGFVNEVVPPSSLLEAAQTRAQQILALSPLAVRASKRCVLEGLDRDSLEVAIDHQRKISVVKQMLASPDRAEGPRAFVNKSSPKWSED